jgi:beta-glucosidase
MLLGLSPRLEGEEGEANLIDKGGDRLDIGLPGVQEELLKEVTALGVPVILVLHSGSAVAINWAQKNVSAVLAMWYGGEEAGTALAEVLFGDVSPAGRLPVTFCESLDQVPPFEDYSMTGRTYRFLAQEPLYPFGFGLSYTRFAYSGLRFSAARIAVGESVEVSAEVANVGDRASDEVVQLYVTDEAASVPVPIRHLEGFQRIQLQPGETRTVSFTLTPEQMACYADDGTPFVEPGSFLVSVGGGQPIPGSPCEYVTGRFEVQG